MSQLTFPNRKQTGNWAEPSSERTTEADSTESPHAHGPNVRCSSTQMADRILIVDDDDALRESLQLVLSAEGYEVVGSPGAGEALRSPLGSPDFAALFPLFALLPRRIGGWRSVVVPAAVSVLLTLGLASIAWTPL